MRLVFGLPLASFHIHTHTLSCQTILNMLPITLSLLALSMVVGGLRYMGFQKAHGYNRIMQESDTDKMETSKAVKAKHCLLASTSIQ